MTIKAKAKTKDFGSEAKDLSFKAKADNCRPRGQGHGLEDSISAFWVFIAVLTI